MMKKNLVIFLLILVFMGQKVYSQTLKTGPWRFELKTTHAVVPFIITIKKSKKRYFGTIHNGKESIKIPRITVNKKNVTIPLQTYEMSLELEIEDKKMMAGHLVRHNKNPKVETPVRAFQGNKERFPEEMSAPQISLDGRWAVTLLDEEDVTGPGVLVFEQNKSKINGSLLTTTGDYRYFEGFVSGKQFEAASFDGIFNYVIKGKVENGKLTASLLSNSITKIEGKMDPKADIPDAYAQTQASAINFKFPDVNGKVISLTDKEFLNKPVIIQLYGSWCPNCMDEMNFLIPWYKTNRQRGIEVVALAFERSLDVKEAKMQLKKVMKKKRVPYPILHVGSTSEDKPMEKIPGLKNFISFPTTIFLNKKHEVVKVHAGFTGPGTGDFFTKWKNEFNQTVNDLLK